MSRPKRILVSSCVRRNIVVYDATMARTECRVGDGANLCVQRLPVMYFYQKHPLFQSLQRPREKSDVHHDTITTIIATVSITTSLRFSLYGNLHFCYSTKSRQMTASYSLSDA
ncbi:hypothetical protein ALC62_11730 [Cyphomyrmex costatus]|uniref:Uncharacterized protein n=1 Tax=Cyphomyrmex costatus TaxID=456900 RepID=A0A195CBE7_9HYME|nr:hypothetical protein ALC62_11730 [Cyphomyrmex costatus]